MWNDTLCRGCVEVDFMGIIKFLGFATTIVLHPLDLVKTRLQVSSVKDYNFLKNFYVVIRNTYKEEGLRAFYQGISPAIIGSVLSWSIYFGAYENAKNRYKRRLDVSQLNGFYNMISSLEAGIIGSTVACPVWFLKTRLQLQNRLCMVHESSCFNSRCLDINLTKEL